MGDKELLIELRGMPDEEIRTLFIAALEDADMPEFNHGIEWRNWLLIFLLDYLSRRPARNTTEYCRTVAFSLRYLAAIEVGTHAPFSVQMVLGVMENRPDIAAMLMFGDSLMRRKALRMAFVPTSPMENPPLEPHQEIALTAFRKRFEERKAVIGPTFDDSTVAKWSRDLIPELEKAVLDEIRPPGQIARGSIGAGGTAAHGQKGHAADLARLQHYIEVTLPGTYGYAFAVAALNDYLRRDALQEESFSSTGRQTLIIMMLIVFSIIFTQWNADSSSVEWLHLARGLCIFGVILMLPFLIGRFTLQFYKITEHISRTRTDIQTLQQILSE